MRMRRDETKICEFGRSLTCCPLGGGQAQHDWGRGAGRPGGGKFKDGTKFFRFGKQVLGITSQETTCLDTGAGGTFSAGVADE